MKNSKSVMWRKAMWITFIVAVIGFAYAAGWMVRWQIVEGEELRSQAINQSLNTTTLTAMRGTIYDATGTKVLAQSASVWTVALEPAYISSDEDREQIAQGLADILGLDKADILEKASDTSSYFTYVKRKIETETKDEILQYMEDKGIERGVRMLEDYKRYYPYGTTASTVLGFTGTDNNGLSGLELEYENELSGTTGRMVSAQNAIGSDMPFQYEQLVNAENGYDLVLTIDETAQSIVEKYLDEGAELYGAAKGATAILMNVKTGAIVALATSGDYDPNDPFTIYDEETQKTIDEIKDEDERDAAESAALQQQWRNKAISDTYVPGSVFKMVTASLALDSGSITTDTTFGCYGEYVPYEGVEPIACWYSGGHGTETVREGICNSCNPFFMQVGQTTGAETFFKYFSAFGFTDITGIDLPGESNSIYYDTEGLGPVELATESFGQGFTITPIQMITACAAIANGGYLVQPHVVDRILDGDGNIISTTDTTYKRQVISEDTAAIVTDILEENATTGSGKNGYVPGYRVAGKTGTSEKVAEYWADPSKLMQYIASFCGFAPANDPQYALLVFYDEPYRDSASGGGMAAPVFANIMKEVLPYLGVESQTSAAEFEEYQTTAPNVITMTVADARAAIEEKGLTAEVYGTDIADDEIVIMQTPSAGAAMPKTGKVVIYTTDQVDDKDLVVVPDFSGKGEDECNYMASQAGVQIVPTGASTSGNLQAQNQDVAAGQKVRPGTVITVTFVDYSGIETVG